MYQEAHHHSVALLGRYGTVWLLVRLGFLSSLPSGVGQPDTDCPSAAAAELMVRWDTRCSRSCVRLLFVWGVYESIGRKAGTRIVREPG